MQTYFTTQQVADKLGVTYLTVYFWIRDNWLPAYKFKKDFRINAKDLNKFIKDRKVETVVINNKKGGENE